MNQTTKITSWLLTALGGFSTFCFMDHYSPIVSPAHFLLFLGSLVPFACLALAAALAASRPVAILTCIAAGLFTVLGGGVYYAYFAVIQDRFSGMLFIIVPALELFVALFVLAAAICSRVRSRPAGSPGLTKGSSQ